MRASISIVILSLAAAFAAPALAQPRDPAGAEVLYRAGRDAAKKEDWATACAKFAESQRLDPAPGTLLNLADCEEHRNQLAAAWQHFVQAQGVLPKGDSRTTYAKTRASSLEKRVPRLTIRLADGAPAGTRVVRDEQELGAASLGMALPVDPGEHVIVAKADGRADGRVTVTLAEGDTKDALVAPGPPGATPAVVPVPPPAKDSAPAQSAPPPVPQTYEPVPTSEGRPVYGYVLLGAGVVGIATGTVAGILALSRAGTVKDTCGPNYATCTNASVDAAHDGKTFSTVSTVGFIAGGVLAGAGLYFLLAPSGSSPRKSAQLMVSPNGAAVTGEF